MAVYVVAVSIVSTAFGRGAVPGPWRVPVGLLPMVPAVLAVFPIMNFYRTVDELQRRIVAEGILFSFVLTAILTFSYGFLRLYAKFSEISMFAVWPLMATLWVVGMVIARRRYGA